MPEREWNWDTAPAGQKAIMGAIGCSGVGCCVAGALLLFFLMAGLLGGC